MEIKSAIYRIHENIKWLKDYFKLNFNNSILKLNTQGCIMIFI